MRVTDISLEEIIKKYLKGVDIAREGQSNRYKTVCPFHGDSSPSLVLYDKTGEGGGWDYHCFACGAHGNAITMLTTLKIAQSEDNAVEMLMRDFNLTFPDKVLLRPFCEFKCIDAEFAMKNGWEDVKQGIAIPYLSPTHDVVSTKIRTKYQGKDKYIYRNDSGSPIAHVIPYGLHWLDFYESTTLYITEGETDCMTLRQAEFQVIGFPSANGFKPEFSTFLERFENLVVVRDNDSAGWNLVTDIAALFPEKLYMVVLPNGIKDINSYHCTKCRGDAAIFRKLFPSLQVLPAAPETFLNAVKDKKLPPTEKGCWEMIHHYFKSEADLLYFKERMGTEAKVSKAVLNASMKQVDIKKDSKKDNGEFTIIDDCYYKLIPMGQRFVETRVSNFIVVPEYDIRSDDEIVRVVTLKNQLGEEKRGVRLDAEALTSTAKFNTCIVGHGNYIWTGTTDDLFKLCIMIFERSKKVVYSPKKIGRIEGGGWVFGNCGIDSLGRVVRIQHGVYELDGKTYAPRSVVLEDGDASTNSDLPTFDIESFRRASHPDYLHKCSSALKRTFGTYGAYLALGWCVAGWFSDQIYDAYGFYPYLFVSGKRSSGKSVLSTMLQGSFGFNAANAGMSIETPSNVGILRYLGYRSSLPCWYDDYRSGVKRIEMKDGLLLDVYNRHGSVKGTKDAGVIRQEQVNGFILLSGEDTPSNNALLTRCVIVQLSASERDADYFAEAQEHMALLNSKALSWAKASTRGTDILSYIDEATKRIFEKNGDIRYARNYGIFAGAFLWAFGESIFDEREFMAHLTKNAYKEKVEIDSAHPMAEFFNDFPDMIAKGFVVRDRDFTVVEDSTTDSAKLGMVALRMRECHKGWCDYLRETKLREKTLRDYVRKEPFFYSEERSYFKAVGRYQSYIVNSSIMEEEFPDFCEAVLQRDYDAPY